MNRTARFRMILTVVMSLLMITGCAAINGYTSPVFVSYSGSKEASKEGGVKIYPYDLTYEPCTSQLLTSTQVDKEWEKRQRDREPRTYVITAYIDRMYIKHLDDYGFSNAELLVVSEVRDGVHAPVRTLVKYAEDAPINDITVDSNNIEIYPPTPYKDKPLEIDIKVIELDEGQEDEIKSAMDLLDLMEKGVKAIFGFVFPGGIVDGLKAIGAMDKNDIELEQRVARIIPTLTYQSEKEADKGLHGGAWRYANGVCKTLDEIGIKNLDLTPHKSFIIIKDLEKHVPQTEPHKYLRYVNGKLCVNDKPDEACTPYKLSTYVVVRVEAYKKRVVEAELAAAALAEHNKKFNVQLEKIGIIADSLWQTD